MRHVIVIFAAGLCLAQSQPQPATPAPLVYEGGRPVQVKPACRVEDLTAAGLSCTEDEPCTFYLELANAATSGSRLVLTGNLHTTSSTLESVLLASDDGGRTWSEAHPRIPLAGLDQVQFAGDYGWVSGESLLTLPRDAFFLLTDDGGKTWRRRPVFAEPRIGMIDRFWFDSRNVGTMIIDRVQGAESGMRWELYETLTGGESWTLRQMSDKPIATARKTAPEPAVRVRAEPGTKAYRVEQRSGAEWHVAARFAVAAGECKPPEQAPEPPPEEPAVDEPAPATPPPAPSLKNGRRR